MTNDSFNAKIASIVIGAFAGSTHAARLLLRLILFEIKNHGWDIFIFHEMNVRIIIIFVGIREKLIGKRYLRMIRIEYS